MPQVNQGPPCPHPGPTGMPGGFGFPGAPQIPGMPGGFGFPGAPSPPGMPSGFGFPGAPQIPGMPSGFGFPGAPQIPGMPGGFGFPGAPSPPGMPSGFGFPGAPQIPAMPVGPKSPSDKEELEGVRKCVRRFHRRVRVYKPKSLLEWQLSSVNGTRILFVPDVTKEVKKTYPGFYHKYNCQEAVDEAMQRLGVSWSG